jgi:hypothetical protein
MNYPKVGPVRVFALDRTIMLVGDGGNVVKLTAKEALELVEHLTSLAKAIDNRGVAGDRCESGNECGRLGCENCQK